MARLVPVAVAPSVPTWHAHLHGDTASLDAGWLFLKARLVAARDSRPATQRLGSQAPVETTEAKGLVQGWAGHGWTRPPHRAMPMSLQLFTPNPTAPRLAERQPVGKWTPRAGPVSSSARLLEEASWMPTCPLHLLLLPAPMPTPSPDPSAPSGALPEPLVTAFLRHHQHGHKSSQGTLMKVSAVFPPHCSRRDG